MARLLLRRFALALALTILSLASIGGIARDFPKNLNIPSDVKSVIFLGQGAHMDWDWLNTFPTYSSNNPPDHTGYFFNPNPLISPQPTDQVFSLATQYLVNVSYQYQVCEMGFLRKFSEDKPDLWAQFRSYAQQGRVSVVGCGITSPDNLLSSGESFIRNYLAGMNFLRSQNLSWSGYIWLPDDFGHDSQLPVLVNAIGAKGVSFSRLPNGCQQGPNQVPQGLVNAHNLLLDEEFGGLEFNWLATDGSQTFTYYMPDTYCSGDFLNTPFIECGTPSQCSECARATFVVSTNDHIQAYINTRAPLTATPYVFTVIGCDFAAPVKDLVNTVNTWNAEKFNQTGYYAVIAPFSTYADSVQGFLKQNPKSSIKQRSFNGDTPQTAFRPSPYWTGFYASRVALKYYHYETSRALVSTEVFALILRAMGVASAKLQLSIDALWDSFSPSTHHDFITGTALDYVYQTEQLPLSIQNYNATISFRNSVLATIVKSLVDKTALSSTPSVVVFNANGFATQGPIIVELSSSPELKEFFAKSNFQETPEGTFVSIASAPSMGFAVQSAKNWSITSLIDRAQGNASILASGNALEWRNDGGNIYRYGYEQDCGFDLLSVRVVPQPAVILEKGPVRTVVRASLLVSGKPVASTKRQSIGCTVCEDLIQEVELLLKANATETQIFSFLESKCTILPGLIGRECKWAIENYGAEIINVIEAWETPEVLCDLITLCPKPAPIDRSFSNETYTIEYTLYQNMPYLIINVTGRAAGTSAVMSKFKFKKPLTGMFHGTPYHWDSKPIFHYGFQADFNLTMEATHEFLAPYGQGEAILGAIYHGSTPSWGLDETSLYGNILRNSPGGTPGCSSYGADGSDTAIHSVVFAFRIPTGLQPPSKGGIQQEARSFTNPLIAMATQQPLKATVPSSYSMASVSNPSSSFLTAAKSGSVDSSKVILRILNPTTGPAEVELSVDPRLVPSRSMQFVSGLEVPLAPTAKLGLVDATYAVTTVALN